MPQAHRSDRNSVVTNQIAVTRKLHSISSLFGSVRLVMASFSDSHIIASALRRATSALGYSSLRLRVVKAFVQGRDVFVSFQTGSRKSIAMVAKLSEL